MNNPLFSVIIPTYNRAVMLYKSINAVVNQTFEDWELIVIDDASNDNTYKVVSDFENYKIKYVKNELNIERSASRNKGIELAKGKYICFLDSDDIWEPNHLEVIYNYLTSNNFPEILLFTGYTWHFSDDNIQNVVLPNTYNFNPVEYIIEYQPCLSSVCISKSILTKYKFNENLFINEDVELFARIVTQYPLIKLNDYTVVVVVHNENTRGTIKDYITPQIQVFKLLCKQPPTAKMISPAFKKKKLKLLHLRLIKNLEERGEIKKMKWELVKFLSKYPTTQGNKSRIVSLIYNMHGGNLIKNFVRRMK